MKNFIIANISKNSRYRFKTIKTLLNAQIENSLTLGWKPNNIILLANFDYAFMGIKSIKIPLTHNCLTGSKIFGMKWLFDNKMVDDIIWSHDLDAWQNEVFDCPDFKDAGIACYSNYKYNGGSIFWRRPSRDIIEEIIKTIIKDKKTIEENSLNKVVKSKKYKHRVTALNNTFNVGCSGFIIRWERSIKPVRVCHFHPYNKIAWESYALDKNGLGETCISGRLEKILRKHYPDLATKLSESGKIAQKERKEKRLKELNA